jgi:MSHA biogenesis protein MshI
MRLSLRQYIAKQVTATRKTSVVGLSLGLESVSLCVLENKNAVITCVEQTEFGYQDWDKALAEYVKQSKLTWARCYIAMTSHHYHLLHIDKPNVPSDELATALEWPVKEMLNPNETYVCDYIEHPVQVSGQNKISVVAMPRSEVKKISELLFDAQLDLQKISVEEFALVPLMPKKAEPILTLSQESGEEIILNIVRDHELYFTRRIKGFENLGSYSIEELEMGLIDSLCVQIQRSMDFFESQLRQAPVRNVMINLDTRLQTEVAVLIEKMMEIKVEIFQPSCLSSEGISLQNASYIALGAVFEDFLEAQKSTDDTRSDDLEKSA